MKYHLENGFDRISFHDSSIESIRRDDKEIILLFDWAKIINCHEVNESEGIVTSECKFCIHGISEQTYKFYIDSDKSWEIKEKPRDFDEKFQLIGENKFINQNKYMFAGAYEPEK